MPYDVSDDDHIQNFILAAALGGVGAYAEDLMWRKIYDVEKTEEDLKNLSEKMDLGEMSKVLTDIRLLENSINEILPEIQKKKEEMLKLQQSTFKGVSLMLQL